MDSEAGDGGLGEQQWPIQDILWKEDLAGLGGGLNRESKKGEE